MSAVKESIAALARIYRARRFFYTYEDTSVHALQFRSTSLATKVYEICTRKGIVPVYSDGPILWWPQATVTASEQKALIFSQESAARKALRAATTFKATEVGYRILHRLHCPLARRCSVQALAAAVKAPLPLVEAELKRLLLHKLICRVPNSRYELVPY